MTAPSILLVDDDEVLSRVLSRVLAREGYAVLEAGNVAQALQMAREHRPQLGLLDLSLPDGDGVELARQLRDQGLDFPLLLITAYPLRLRDHPELGERFSQVLTKPLNVEELRQAIETTLARPTPVVSREAAPAPAAVPALTQEVLARPDRPEPEAHRLPALPEPETPTPGRWRVAWWLGGAAVAAIVLFVALPALGMPTIPDLIKAHRQAPVTAPPTKGPSFNLADGDSDTLEVDADTIRSLDVKTVVVSRDVPSRPLVLPGSLAFDPNHLHGAQSRFAGEVIEVGTNRDPGEEVHGSTGPPPRPLQYGDHVKKGQLLAVVWSKDLGATKADLVDALSQLHLDQVNLNNIQELYAGGNTSEAALRQAERSVQNDRNAVNKAERTLKTWRVSDEEIQAVKDEARSIIARKGRHDPEKEKNWARVEVRAPFAGTIVEKNFTVGRMVDPTFDLFKVANLDRMAVYAYAYEEDMEALHALRAKYKGRPIPWEVRLSADQRDRPLPSEGIEQIGYVVDPNQHTDLVMGLVDNSGGELTAGQFVTATVRLPPPPGVVAVPNTALVEDGNESVLFVQADPDQPRRFTLKRVVVTQRFGNLSYVRSQLDDARKKKGLYEVKPGDRVISEGAMELKAGLEEARSQARKE